MQTSWNMHGILNFLKDCGILNFFKDCGILNFFKDCGIFEVSSFLIQYSKLWKCIPISAFTLIYIYDVKWHQTLCSDNFVVFHSIHFFEEGAERGEIRTVLSCTEKLWTTLHVTESRKKFFLNKLLHSKKKIQKPIFYLKNS